MVNQLHSTVLPSSLVRVLPEVFSCIFEVAFGGFQDGPRLQDPHDERPLGIFPHPLLKKPPENAKDETATNKTKSEEREK